MKKHSEKDVKLASTDKSRDDWLTSWVEANQKLCEKLETILRVVSYLVAGRPFPWSRQLSELVYSASTLLHALLVEVSYQKSSSLKYHDSFLVRYRTIKLVLSTLESFEVFLEVLVFTTPSDIKWSLISVVESIKFALNSFLIFFPRLSKARQSSNMTAKVGENETFESASSQSLNCVTLSRSKLQIRTIASAATEKVRNWKLNVELENEVPSYGSSAVSDRYKAQYITCTPAFNQVELLAELLYISRPLIYLLTRRLSGPNSYKPWMVSFITEISSLLIHDFGLHLEKEALRNRGGDENNNCNNDSEIKEIDETKRREMKRRTMMLLLYLLRSPLYENRVESNIMALFLIVTSCVPGSYYILNPLINYLPQWQKLHFNVWCK